MTQLKEIRARYIEIHARAGWGNASECFDSDIQEMPAEMLRDLGAVYLALAEWKLSCIGETSGKTPATPRLVRDSVAHVSTVSTVSELPQGPKTPHPSPIAA